MPLLVFLDTTEIVSDPLCSGVAWRILAHRPSSWKVRVITTDVVIEEAAAHYVRETQAALGMMEKFEGKFGRPLGLSIISETAQKQISAAQDSYQARLRDLLEDAGVKVVPLAKLPHMMLVSRATSRRKPCNQNGDGYRDTLNWLTFVQRVRKSPGSDAVLVTRNTKDFQADSGQGLHGELLEDLSEAGVSGIRLLNSVADLALEMVTNLSADQPIDLKQADATLHNGSLAGFVRSEVLFQPISKDLNAEKCGLALGTRKAWLVKVFGVSDIALDVVGQAAEDTSLARFSAVLDADVAAEISNTQDLGCFDSTSSPDPDTGLLTAWVRKALVVEGILTIGNHDMPVAGEISDIRALPDDPGIKPWKELKRQSGTPSGVNRQLTNALAQIQGQPSTAALVRQFAEALSFNNAAVLAGNEVAMRHRVVQDVIRQLNGRATGFSKSKKPEPIEDP